ncbi:hypothetical protein DFAR_2480005 [Desulfarculales bacterium]
MSALWPQQALERAPLVRAELPGSLIVCSAWLFGPGR